MSADSAEIILRPARATDEGTIRRWFVAPHVARWSLPVFPTVVDTLDNTLEDPDSGLRIAEMDGRLIGCVHIYKAFGDPNWEAVEEVTEKTRAIDFLLGETDMTNKKIGQRMLRMIAEYIFSNPEIDRIVACPHSDNWAAIIALKRIGFREKGRHPDPSLNAMYLTVTPATLKK